MPENVISLAEGFQSQLNRRDTDAIMAMQRRWAGVEGALDQGINQLADEMAALQAAGEEVPAYKLWQMDRYQSLLGQLGREMAKFGAVAIADMKDDAAASQLQAQRDAKKMMLAQLESDRAAQLSFDRLPTGAVENLSSAARGGAPLGDLLKNAYGSAAQGLTNLLLKGTALGQNPRLTARQAIKQGLTQGLSRFLLISRDQQIRNYREMARHQYDRSPAVYGYMRIAAKKANTCMACIALDGTIYPTNVAMNLHPQDRCSMIPLVEGAPVPKPFKSARQWFRDLPEENQRSMMGPGAWAAWQEDAFKLKDLATLTEHPKWGPSARVTPLKKLVARPETRPVPIDPKALQRAHVAAQKAKPIEPIQAKVIEVDQGDQALLEGLSETVQDTPGTSQPARLGMENALDKILTGQQGFIFTDEQGRLQGALSYSDTLDPEKLKVTAAGFSTEEANLRAVTALAETARDGGKGIQSYVPKGFADLYKSWGFTTEQKFLTGNRMGLKPEDLAGFLDDPANFGTVKVEEKAEAAAEALADPDAGFKFFSGEELPGLPFKSVTMGDDDFTAGTKVLPYEPEFQVVSEGKTPGAGMMLFTPDGKLVIVDPTNEFGGYKTTYPKGGVEEGMTLQETAVKEVYEESGFKAKVVGLLGDYEKGYSHVRYYMGVIEDGAPWDAHYETASVQIVPLDDARALFNQVQDKAIFDDLHELHAQALAGKPFTPEALEAGLDKLSQQQADNAATLAKTQLEHDEKLLDGGEAFDAWQAAGAAALADPGLTVEELKKVQYFAEHVSGRGIDNTTANLVKLEIAELEAKARAPGQVHPRPTEGMPPVDEPLPPKIAPPPPGANVTKANQYVTQLVNAADFTPADILTAVKAEFPKTIFTLANVEGKFQSEGIVPPAVSGQPDRLEVANQAGLQTAYLKMAAEGATSFGQVQQAVLHAWTKGYPDSSINRLAQWGSGDLDLNIEVSYAKNGTPVLIRSKPVQKELLKAPAGDKAPDQMTKKALADHLVAEGFTKWKVNQLNAGQVKALFKMTAEEAAEAVEAAGAAHATKYKGGGQATLADVERIQADAEELDPAKAFRILEALPTAQPDIVAQNMTINELNAALFQADKLGFPPGPILLAIQAKKAQIAEFETDAVQAVEDTADLATIAKTPLVDGDVAYSKAKLLISEDKDPGSELNMAELKAAAAVADDGGDWVALEILEDTIYQASLPLETARPADVRAQTLLQVDAEPLKLSPPDAGPPAELTKKALVDHLAQLRGVAKWKANQLTKPQLVGLFDLPEADALATIEAAGAAHATKYKSGTAKVAEPDPAPADDPAKAAYDKWLAPVPGGWQAQIDKMTQEELNLVAGHALKVDENELFFEALENAIEFKVEEQTAEKFREFDLTEEDFAQMEAAIDIGEESFRKFMAVSEAQNLNEAVKALSVEELEAAASWAFQIEDNAKLSAAISDLVPLKLEQLAAEPEPAAELTPQEAYQAYNKILGAGVIVSAEEVADLMTVDELRLALDFAHDEVPWDASKIENTLEVKLDSFADDLAQRTPTGPKIPLPDAGPPDSLTKTALVDHLLQTRGIAKWKANALNKGQLVALFDMPEVDAIAAVEAAGAAHAAKYKGGAAKVKDQAEELARMAGQASNQGGIPQVVNLMSFDEIRMAYAHVKAKGENLIFADTLLNAANVSKAQDALQNRAAFPDLIDDIPEAELDAMLKYLKGPYGYQADGWLPALEAQKAKHEAQKGAVTPDTMQAAWDKFSYDGLHALTVTEAQQALAFASMKGLDFSALDELAAYTDAEALQIDRGWSHEEIVHMLAVTAGLTYQDLGLLSIDQIKSFDGKGVEALQGAIENAKAQIPAAAKSLALKTGNSIGGKFSNADIIDALKEGGSVQHLAQAYQASILAGYHEDTQLLIGEALLQKVNEGAFDQAPKIETPATWPGDPTVMKKADLAQSLADFHGIPAWKVKLLTAAQLKQLANGPAGIFKDEVDFAAEQFTIKKKAAVAAKKAAPAEKDIALNPKALLDTYQMNGAVGMTAEQLKVATAAAKAAGWSKLVIKQMDQEIGLKTGDPLVHDYGNDSTKAFIVANMAADTGISSSKLLKLTKAQLVSKFGKPESELNDLLGLKFEAKPDPNLASPEKFDAAALEKAKKAAAEQEKATQIAAEKPQDLQKMDPHELSNFFTAIDLNFPVGSPAAAGVSKAQQNITNSGNSAFGYRDTDGIPIGVVAFEDQGQAYKVNGAAFGTPAVNREAMADVANAALAVGKAVKTWVPGKFTAQYQKWGFQADDGGSGGGYYSLPVDKAPKFIEGAGKTPNDPPPLPTPKFVGQAQAAQVEPGLGLPLGKSKAGTLGMKKDALILHLSDKSGQSSDTLAKYTKAQLVTFMEMPGSEAVSILLKGGKPPGRPAGRGPVKLPPSAHKKRPLPRGLPDFTLPDPPGFPASISQVQSVRSLGGTTGAQLVAGPDGRQYVMKRGGGRTPDKHILEEAYADSIYRAMGVNVPEFKIYETPEGPVKLAEFQGNTRTLGEALSSATPGEQAKIRAQLQKDFAVDALLGNWDAVGTGLDNVLVDDAGKVWRIDNGGSLRYRAQGSKKTAADFDEWPVDLWSMRDRGVAVDGGATFGGLDIYQVMGGVKNVVNKRTDILAAVPPELRSVVNARIENMRDLMETSDTIKADSFGSEYADGFLESSARIRKEGVLEHLPAELKRTRKGAAVSVYDEEGRKYDRLREATGASPVSRLEKFMRTRGLDPEIIASWASSQAGDSWTDGPRALKYMLAKARGNFQDFFWRGSLAKNKKIYESHVRSAGGEEKYRGAFQAHHAFVYESLRAMDFEMKEGGEIRLVRTEASDVMSLNGIKVGMRGFDFPRGAAESHSIYRTVNVNGTGELHRLKVPLHRVLGHYFMRRPGGAAGKGMFLGSNENEFVVMPEGLPTDYVASRVHSSQSAENYWNQP